ncbi:hypothetical protein E2C01_094224 [Portunus trituberculatus]|uniref:Uncharacterized protein n=1 Tax=Portunus trituberculatus TaxID=210409 RepID=A0A5B7JVL1_PORTR|nr:hypothetical protein [Portunus trituberculatus]
MMQMVDEEKTKEKEEEGRRYDIDRRGKMKEKEKNTYSGWKKIGNNMVEFLVVMVVVVVVMMVVAVLR